MKIRAGMEMWCAERCRSSLAEQSEGRAKGTADRQSQILCLIDQTVHISMTRRLIRILSGM